MWCYFYEIHLTPVQFFYFCLIIGLYPVKINWRYIKNDDCVTMKHYPTLVGTVLKYKNNGIRQQGNNIRV